MRWPSESPGLPPAIAHWLEQRNYLIPQYTIVRMKKKDKPDNAFQGRFYSREQTDWAVLATDHGKTRLFIFRGGSTDNIVTIDKDPWHYSENKNEERWDLHHHEVIFSNDSTSIWRQYHTLVEGGFKVTAPPIDLDHDGLGRAALEKSSQSFYYYKGRWIKTVISD